MKFSLLLLFFFVSSAHAGVMQDNACFWIFTKLTVQGEARPATILSSLGLQEGTDFYGENDQSIEVVDPKATAASILLAKFQARRPNIRLFYSTKPLEVEAAWALMRMGKNAAQVHIPLTVLTNYRKLQNHIVQLSINLKKIETLLQEPVDFLVSQMKSVGFDLEIEGFRSQPIDPQLAWMWRRQNRHQLAFAFTNHLVDETFSEHSLGASVGRSIRIAEGLLFSESQDYKATLAHEIVHSTNVARFQKYGDASSQIIFLAGQANTMELIVRVGVPESYKRFFGTDEVEAWKITEKLNPGIRHKDGVKFEDFLVNQIEWLEELQLVLPGQLVVQESTWARMTGKDSPEAVFVTTSSNKPGESADDFKFVLFAGAPNEVVVVIPRSQSKIEELGSAKAYLLDAIDRRLHQLRNRAKVSGIPY